MPQSRAWQAAVFVLLALFGFFAFESLRLSLSDTLGPGPGFFPFWLSVVGGLLGVFLLIQLARRSVEFEAPTLKFELRPVAMVMGGLVVATALLEWLGFRVAALLLIVYLLVALGARNWIAITVVALAGSFGVYHVFSGLLKVPLP
jgi:putative tricarboxylic transport membrane protein